MGIEVETHVIMKMSSLSSLLWVFAEVQQKNWYRDMILYYLENAQPSCK